MSHYRKIDVRIWNDAKFVSLTSEGRLAWFMLLTHPMMTSLGAIRATPDGLAAELSSGAEGLREGFRKALLEIIDKGMADYDPHASLIALPNFLKYNRPESPNVVKAWAGAADMLPECELKTLTIQRAKDYAEGLSEGFRKAIGEAFPKASSIQRAEKQRTESRDSRAYENRREGVSTHARQSAPPKPNSYAAAKDGYVSTQPFPIPGSEAAGQTFLRSRGVPDGHMGRFLPSLMEGSLYPFDIEEYEVRA